MKLDRRRNFRKVPEKFAFIQLDRDDGGAVLNVSEGGLSFNTFAPVDQNGPIHFWFSLNLNEQIDAWGEVTWTNETKKVGGLRFIRLPERAGRQIREWISETYPQQAPDERFRTQAAAGTSRSAPREPDAVAKFVSKARSQRAPILASSEDSGGPTSALPPPGEMAATGELVPMQRYRSEKRRQFSHGLLLGICISAAVAVPAIKYSNYRHENKGSATVSSDLAAQKSDAQASTSVTASTPSTRDRPSLDIFSGVKTNTGAPSNHTRGNPLVANARQPQPRASEITMGNRPAQTTAEPSLSGTPKQRKTSLTPRQLWAAVQSGNSQAAVALAELYIKGEGVPQNCDQARVLLLMASEKRNAEAIKRLHELDKTGCP